MADISVGNIWQNRSYARSCTDRRGGFFEDVFIEEDFTPAVKDIRKDVIPIAAEARSIEGNTASVNGDVLVVNGVQYKHNELDKLPAWLQQVCDQQGNMFLGCFSL